MVIRNWTNTDYLNCEELNRIESNIAECYMLAYGDITDLNVVTDRGYSYIDTVSSFNRIEKLIDDLSKDKIQVKYWDSLKTNWKAFDSLSYKDLNRIEQNIEYIYNILDKDGAIVYVGEMRAGEKELIGGVASE